MELKSCWDGMRAGLAKSMRAFAEDLHLPRTLAFLVIVGEFLGGVGLIIGLFSRITALVIAVTMLGAIATVHFRFGLFLNWFGGKEGHGIEYHLPAIVLALVIVANGAGAFSLDRVVSEHLETVLQTASGNRRSSPSWTLPELPKPLNQITLEARLNMKNVSASIAGTVSLGSGHPP